MTAGMTFTASRFRVGVESLDLNELAEADEKFGELALDGYKTWIDRAKTARIANEFYLALTVLFVLLAVLFLTFEAIRLSVENWPTIVVVPISILFVVWYIIRIQTVIVGWMEWHHPRMMHLMHRQVSNARTLFWAPRDVLSRVLFPVPGGEMNGVESVGRDEQGSFDEDQNGTEGSPETPDSTKMHSTVGTIRGVDLQKWVVENIEQIEEGLKVVEVQSRVGQFNPDILCRDDRDRWVVVEIKLTPRPDDPYVLRDYVKGLEKATDEEARGILVGFHIPERVKKELRKLSLEFWEAPSDVHSILESTG